MGDAAWEPAVQRGLPRRILSHPGADHVAHDAFVDGGRVEVRAADGFRDDERAQLWRGKALQRAEELAGRRANCARNDHVTHECSAPG
jgi:hypothetical protein